MEVKPLFYAWVPPYARYAILTLLTFVALCVNGVFSGITIDMYSDLVKLSKRDDVTMPHLPE